MIRQRESTTAPTGQPKHQVLEPADHGSIELRVEVSGRWHARYEWDSGVDRLRLIEVADPAEWYPADFCSVTDGLNERRAPLPALLLGNVSHPPECLVWARPLGMIEIETEGERGQIRWGGPEQALAAVLASRQRFRITRSDQREGLRLRPTWKPINLRMHLGRAGDEAEHHSAAEYSFFALPYRFQHYVEEYLAADERIPCAVRRPAMHSTLRRGLLSHRKLEEGLLVVSDQQITSVVELLPPDRAGIRYGFVARSGVPECLESVRLSSLARHVLGLELTWRAASGPERVTFEFPGALSALLTANDAVLARCLLPAWVEGRRAASVLAVTDRRLVVVPDPVDEKGAGLQLEIPLPEISSLEFCSTIVLAYLMIYVPEGSAGGPRVYTIHFGKTQTAMNTCYLALRRALATTAINRPYDPGAALP